MSIYGTLPLDFTIEDEDAGLEPVKIYMQAVPAHIQDTGPLWAFLPAPVADPNDYRALRAVVFCAPWTTKGTARNGQEYANPLLTLSGAEYETIPFVKLTERLRDAAIAYLDSIGESARARVLAAPPMPEATPTKPCEACGGNGFVVLPRVGGAGGGRAVCGWCFGKGIE